MDIDFESALAGEYGEEARQAAETAVRGALDAIARMFKPSIDAGLAVGAATGGFATGGAFNASAGALRVSNGECIMPKSEDWREVPMPAPTRVVEIRSFSGPARIKGVIE